jgi:hypothetical protein
MPDNDPFPWIEAVRIDLDELARFTSEEDFNAISVSLLVEVGSYATIAACTLGETKLWSRDRAAIGGNLVRLYKLLSAFLDQYCQRRLETSFILARLVFETVVNVSYLIKNYSPELVDSYVRHSLRHERQLRDKVLANIKQRGGSILPIEQRMLNSIERAANFAEVSLDSIDLKDRSPWGGKSFRSKAISIGLDDAYLAMFGGASHYVHGSWQDLHEYHLTAEQPGSFSPRLKWKSPRPHLALGVGHIVVWTVQLFFEWLSAAATEPLREALSDLDERLSIVDRAHEQYLSGREWPAI